MRLGFEPVGEGSNNPRRCQVLALFAGVGGIEIGLEQAGHKTVVAFEVDQAAQEVLKHRFPTVDIQSDIREFDSVPKCVDIVTAGFPCVDLSPVGQLRGLDGPGSGLVRHALQVVTRSSVDHLLLENVPFMLRLSKGAAMAEIASILEAGGFRWCYRVIDARAFGVPQRRPRVLLFASRTIDPRGVLLPAGSYDKPVAETRPVVGGTSIGFYSTEGNTGAGLVADATPPIKPGSKLGIASPPAILLRDGSVGTPSIRDAERLQGMEADWTVAAEHCGRNSRWRLVGNAVNVRVSNWLGGNLAKAFGPFEGSPTDVRAESSWPTAAWNVNGTREGFSCPVQPRLESMTPLHQFLSEELRPLSVRATSGFVSRAEKSSLRFPPGFLDMLTKHIARFAQISPPP